MLNEFQYHWIFGWLLRVHIFTISNWIFCLIFSLINITNGNLFFFLLSEIKYEAILSIRRACGHCHKLIGRTGQRERRHRRSYWYRFRNNIFMVSNRNAVFFRWFHFSFCARIRLLLGLYYRIDGFIVLHADKRKFSLKIESCGFFNVKWHSKSFWDSTSFHLNESFVFHQSESTHFETRIWF